MRRKINQCFISSYIRTIAMISSLIRITIPQQQKNLIKKQFYYTNSKDSNTSHATRNFSSFDSFYLYLEMQTAGKNDECVVE